MRNGALNRARRSVGTDEWYTPYEVIDEELAHYVGAFDGRSVLCCCDDPVLSDFAYYFLRNFNVLGLRRLVCTSYAGSRAASVGGHRPLSLPKGFCPGPSYGTMLVVDAIDAAPGIVDDGTLNELLAQEGVLRQMEGDGDFRSSECRRLIRDCDICCTNPPFSLFTELFRILSEYGRQYLLIGNQNALLYKEIFPYVMADKTWVGYRFGDMRFRVPPDTEPRATRYWVDDTGQKWRSLGNAMWLTNIDIPRRRRPLALTASYDEAAYPRFDGQDVISVRRVRDIPKDYYGVMGVPLTFMKYHDSSQFEIVGEANHGSDSEFDLFKPMIGGRERFKCLLIRRAGSKHFGE